MPRRGNFLFLKSFKERGGIGFIWGGALLQETWFGEFANFSLDTYLGVEAQSIIFDHTADAESSCLGFFGRGQPRIYFEHETSEATKVNGITIHYMLYGFLDECFHASGDVGAGEGAGVGDVVCHHVEGVLAAALGTGNILPGLRDISGIVLEDKFYINHKILK